jgi:hypothetical protein
MALAASKEFEKRLKSEIQALSRQHHLSDDKAFGLWFAMNILELTEPDALAATQFDGPNDKSVDFFWIDDDAERVFIGQFKYSPTLSATARTSHVALLQASLNWLTNPNALRKDGKPDLATAADEYLEATAKGYCTELWYIYAGPRATFIDNDVRLFNQKSENLDKGISACHAPLEFIENTYREIQGASLYIDSAVIKLEDKSAVETDGSFGKALVAVVPAEELSTLYHKHQDRLFDGNVRLFLGARRNTVNAGILETLNDRKQRGNFWAYNNGITFICDDFKKVGKNLKLYNFSIVNGCQTTTLLAESGVSLADVKILARFIAAPKDVVDKVVLFNNSQNPVKPWDIASRNKTQRRLKTEFNALPRSINYWTRRGKKPQSTKTPSASKPELLPFERVGQYLAAFDGNPVLAWKHKGFIFQSEHDSVFRPDITVEHILLAYICGEISTKAVLQKLKSSSEEDSRILRKGGSLFVLATLGTILLERNGATFFTKLKQERIESNSTHLKIGKYTSFALKTYVRSCKHLMVAEKMELSTLVRSRDYYKSIRGLVKSDYETFADSESWLSDTLPRIEA